MRELRRVLGEDALHGPQRVRDGTCLRKIRISEENRDPTSTFGIWILGNFV